MSLAKASLNALDIHSIMQTLPHRYPFLLVDKVLDYKPDDYLIGLKNVSINEPFFTGHFPHRPVMPGVLVLEALAQATGILAFKTLQINADNNTLYYFAGVDKARFRKPVEPGDQLELKVKLIKRKQDLWKFFGEVFVEGKLVCSAELMCSKQDI